MTQGQVALVDADDLQWLTRWNWCAWKEPNSGVFYAKRADRENGRNSCFLMHREILGLTEFKDKGDHIDHNTLNNQRTNLRKSTHAENLRNRGKNSNNTTGFKGVIFDKDRGCFAAQVKVDGKNYFLGYFVTAEEAYKVYTEKLPDFHGEFAYWETEKEMTCPSTPRLLDVL